MQPEMLTLARRTFKLSDLEGVAAELMTESRTKVFEYKVTETGSAAGVTNDPDAVTGKTFTITLTDDGKRTADSDKGFGKAGSLLPIPTRSENCHPA